MARCTGRLVDVIDLRRVVRSGQRRVGGQSGVAVDLRHVPAVAAAGDAVLQERAVRDRGCEHVAAWVRGDRAVFGLEAERGVAAVGSGVCALVLFAVRRCGRGGAGLVAAVGRCVERARELALRHTGAALPAAARGVDLSRRGERVRDVPRGRRRVWCFEDVVVLNECRRVCQEENRTRRARRTRRGVEASSCRRSRICRTSTP